MRFNAHTYDRNSILTCSTFSQTRAKGAQKDVHLRSFAEFLFLPSLRENLELFSEILILKILNISKNFYFIFLRLDCRVEKFCF